MTGEPDDIDIAASYSRQDTARVVPLLDALKARGVGVWFDKNIPGGALWEETITRNMRRAKAVLFFVSRASLDSDRCFDEVSAARTLRKPIVPVLVEPVRMPDDLPDRLVLTLQTRNTVDAYPGADGDPVATLMHALSLFGVRPRDGAPAPAAEAVPVAPPAPAIAVAAPPPAAASLVPPPGARPRRALMWGTLAAMALVLVAAAGLYAGGVIGGAAPPKVQIAEADWCLRSAPHLLKSAMPPAGLSALQSAADDGDLDAQTLVCLSANKACTGGEGDAAAMAAAYAACVKAGDRGRWRAVFNQGWLKQRGCGVPVDGSGAAAAVTRAAEANCAIAQFYLGTLYQDGELVDFDEAKAIRWLQAAADQNYPPALNRMGAAYALGRGVPEDDAKGTEYYRRAADLGDARAMLNYARALEQGVGTDRNTGAAIAYYRRAAEQSDEQEIRDLANQALERLGAAKPART